MRPIVTDRVGGLSLDRSVTVVSPAKTAEPIEMPLGLRTRVGPRNHVRLGVQIPMGMDNFEREDRPIVNGNSAVSCAKRLYQSRYRLGYGLELAQETMYYMGVQIPLGKGQF